LQHGKTATKTNVHTEVGTGWHVDVAWEYGMKEEIPGFRSEAEAQDWLDHKSGAWLQVGIKREKTKKGRR
jgi:hypothetical protein